MSIETQHLRTDPTLSRRQFVGSGLIATLATVMLGRGPQTLPRIQPKLHRRRDPQGNSLCPWHQATRKGPASRRGHSQDRGSSSGQLAGASRHGSCPHRFLPALFGGRSWPESVFLTFPSLRMESSSICACRRRTRRVWAARSESRSERISVPSSRCRLGSLPRRSPKAQSFVASIGTVLRRVVAVCTRTRSASS